jgi:hypothetical protein
MEAIQQSIFPADKNVRRSGEGCCLFPIVGNHVFFIDAIAPVLDPSRTLLLMQLA